MKNLDGFCYGSCLSTSQLEHFVDGSTIAGRGINADQLFDFPGEFGAADAVRSMQIKNLAKQ